MLINFWLADPNHNILVNQPQVSLGDHSIEAQMDGKYTYCFMHEGRDSYTREVSFNVHGVVYVSEDDPEHQDPLEKQIKELSELVAQVKDELEYIVIREQVHRNTSESTNSRVKWWSIGETVLLVAVCLFQVIYLSKFSLPPPHLQTCLRVKETNLPRRTFLRGPRLFIKSSPEPLFFLRTFTPYTLTTYAQALQNSMTMKSPLINLRETLFLRMETL